MAQKEYISVDYSTRNTDQKVIMKNSENQFTGEFSISQNGGSSKNIKELFIQGAETDEGQVIPVDGSSGKLILKIPKLGDDNKIETIKVNGTALTPDGSKAVDIAIPEPGDTNVIESISLEGAEGSRIDATIVDKHATIKLTELEIEEMHTNQLYINGNSLSEIVPNVQ